MLAAVLPPDEDRYVALFDGDPTVDGVELTLAGYARVAHSDWTTSVPDPGNSERSNASAIEFPTITEEGTADHWAIFDAETDGNLLRYGRLTDFVGMPSPILFTGTGEEATFNIGAIKVGVRDV